VIPTTWGLTSITTPATCEPRLRALRASASRFAPPRPVADKTVYQATVFVLSTTSMYELHEAISGRPSI
jgi:hypothetical protein